MLKKLLKDVKVYSVLASHSEGCGTFGYSLVKAEAEATLEKMKEEGMFTSFKIIEEPIEKYINSYTENIIHSEANRIKEEADKKIQLKIKKETKKLLTKVLNEAIIQVERER